MDKEIDNLLNELEDTGAIKILIPVLNTIKQHIQSQQEEINVLKKERNNWIDENSTLYVINRKLSTKLNDIKEIVKEFYSNQEVMSYFTIDKIKEVLNR